MPNDKIIAVVGVSEELTAHLRLLLRRAMPVLNQSWKWGAEDLADLVVVDPRDLAGQMARTRCQSAGVRCASILNEDDPEESGFTLRLPFKLEPFVEVMRGAARPTVTQSGKIEHADEDFYFKSNDDHGPADPDSNDFWTRARARAEATAAELKAEQQQKKQAARPDVAMGLDEMLKNNAQVQKQPQRPAVKLDDKVTIQAAPTSGARADKRQGDSVRGILGEKFSDEDMLKFAKDEIDQGERYLRDMLKGTEVSAPSQYQAESGPVLTLDPKNQVFHANVRLSRLADLCGKGIPLKALRVVTSKELNDIRAREQALPYADLLWLDVMVAGTGHLARNLDPAGTYKLKREVAVEPQYRNHGKIIAVMAGGMKRLNEIAQEAGVKMDDVFDLVNAYDAIGELEWLPRQRRTGQTPVVAPDKGLLGKIKWPFGKK